MNDSTSILEQAGLTIPLEVTNKSLVAIGTTVVVVFAACILIWKAVK